MYWITVTRIAAAFAVVILHVAAIALIENPVGSAYWQIGNAYDSAVRWCVPVFVLVSGYLLGHKHEETGPFYRKRLNRVLWPMLFWTVFYTFWTGLKMLLMDGDIRTTELLTNIISGNPYYHMWYMYMLLGLYAFAPFLNRFLVTLSSSRHLFFSLILLSASLAYAIVDFWFYPIEPLFIFWFVEYLGYYCLGAYWKKESNFQLRPRQAFLVFIASVVTVYWGYSSISLSSGVEVGRYFYAYSSIPVIVMSLAVFSFFKGIIHTNKGGGMAGSLAAASLGIYLIHPVIIDVLRFIGISAGIIHPIVSIPLISLFAIAASFAVTFAMQRVPFLKKVV